ncbi:hypothetical protein Tco_0553932 [Tanacetum coccineum]
MRMKSPLLFHLCGNPSFEKYTRKHQGMDFISHCKLRVGNGTPQESGKTGGLAILGYLMEYPAVWLLKTIKNASQCGGSVGLGFLNGEGSFPIKDAPIFSSMSFLLPNSNTETGGSKLSQSRVKPTRIGKSLVDRTSTFSKILMKEVNGFPLVPPSVSKRMKM